jgi:hypothetical protein
VQSLAVKRFWRLELAPGMAGWVSLQRYGKNQLWLQDNSRQWVFPEVVLISRQVICTQNVANL